MGLSIVISGAIIFVALIYVLMTIPNVLDSISSVDEASSEISVLEDSISQTETSLNSLSALIGKSTVNFTLNNDGSEKLWNFEKFNLIITYDADIGGIKTKVTEQLTYNPDGISCVIGFDDVSTSSSDTSPISFLHSVTTSGADRILIVGVSAEGGETVDSVDYGGQPLIEIRTDDGGDALSSLWYLVDPPTGSNSVDVTFSADVEAIVGAMSFTCVHQTNPIDVDNGDTGSDDTPTVGLTTNVDNAWIVDVVGTVDGPLNPTVPQTERWDILEGSTAGGGSTRVTTTSGPYTMIWDNVEGGEEWGISAAALTPISCNTQEDDKWFITSYNNDILDPKLVNQDESIDICAKLIYPVFPGGSVIISLSTDLGVTITDSVKT